MKWLPLLTGLALLATACAPPSKDRSMEPKDASMADSGKINCATAKADIRVLQSEQSNAMEQLQGGGTTMVPSGLVTEPEFGVNPIGAGQYHDYLGDRISRIQQTCGL
jgi:hypothetical protein